MRKGKRKSGWMAAVGLLIAVLIAGSAQAQELVFEEPFENPDLPGWEHSPGVAAEGGVLRIEPGAHTLHPESWGDARIVAQVRWEGEGEFILGSRAYSDSGYLLLVGREYLVIQREQGGKVTELAAAGGIPVPYQDWFQLELLLVSGNQQVFINETLVLEAEDPEPLPGGGLSLETLGGATLEVDHLAVYPAGDGSPAPEEAPSAAFSFEGNLTWIRTGGPLGGLGYDVRMHPDNPDIMYVTDALAGVFKSTDGGRNWFPSNQGISVRTGASRDNIPIFCLTIDPHDPETIWVGTQHKRGIFKSGDSGATWTMKVNGIIENEGITFRGITVDPQNPQIIYAAAEISSWVWAGQEQIGREFEKVKGVVYKSTNGGENWQAVWRGDSLARYILIDPRDSNVLYVSTGIFDREAANSDAGTNTPGGVGVLKSTDGGQTWAQINTGLTNLYIGSLAMNPDNPDLLLAGAANNAYREGAGVFLTTDGGQNWARVLEQEAQSVEFSTSNPMIAYAGNPGFIFRSADGGVNWELMLSEAGSWGAPGVTAGFPIDFQVDPRNPDRIFANNYGGGNFLSEDGGRTWMDASAGYTGAQVRALAVSPTEPGVIYAAARSGIFVSTNGGEKWSGLIYPNASGLEWNAVAIDPRQPTHILGANNWSRFLGESHNGGLSWSRLELPELGMQGLRAIEFAPSDTQVAYAGFAAFYSAGSFDSNMPASGIYISRDGGSNWSAANDGLTATANISGLAIHPNDPMVVFAASPASGLFQTVNGGGNWTRLNGLPGNVRPSSVAINPTDPNQILIGSEGRGLYRTVDGGQAWTQVYAGIPAEAVILAILYHPTTPGVVFCGDLLSGVYRSSDGGQTWLAMSEGLRTRAVSSLAISADGWHLYAGTDGEGVFRLDFSGQSPEAGEPLARESAADGEPPEQEENPPGSGQPPEEKSSPPAPDNPGEAVPGRTRFLSITIGAGVLALAVVVILVLARRRKT